jgi:DNA repair protein RadA/Sms
MVLAVLETRCGLVFSGSDVYLNVAGGLRIAEPAADLAVAAALVSSLTGQVVPHGAVVFGEIGLSGEVRAVGQTEARLKEAQKLGFAQALLPAGTRGGADGARAAAREPARGGLERREIAELADLVALFAAASVARPAHGQRAASPT